MLDLKTVSKKGMHFRQNLDIETLEAKVANNTVRRKVSCLSMVLMST